MPNIYYDINGKRIAHSELMRNKDFSKWFDQATDNAENRGRKEAIEAIRDKDNRSDGADTVPCLNFKYHWTHRDGRIFCVCGWIENMHKLIK